MENNLVSNQQKVICVIPAFNEEKTLAAVLDSISGMFDEVIVVDDGSSDDTFQIAKEKGVVALRHPLNRGQGAALETGNRMAKKMGTDIVLHFDADGQFLANEIKDVLRPILEDECDVVFGSRFLGKKSNMPVFKTKILFPIARLVNYFFGITTTDPQSGFRAMNKKALSLIRISNDGSAHCSEILFKVSKLRLRIKEVPITVIYNEFGQGLLGGKGRGKGGITIIKDLIIQKIIG